MLFPIHAVFQIIFQTNIRINLLHQERKRIYFETLNAIESTSTSTAVNKADDGIKSPHNDHENLKVMLYVTTHMSPLYLIIRLTRGMNRGDTSFTFHLA